MEAVVEFEYQAEQEDELSLKVGDIITNVVTAEGGWWEGELNGKKGMFPENFVKLVKRREPASSKKEEKREATQRKSVRELANKFKDGVPISVVPKKKEKKKKCKVLFEYKKENDDELELQVGDIIEFHKQVEEGWWEGSLNGKHGVFPSNFVEMIEEQSSSDESGQTNSEDKDKTSESQGKDENFQAIKGKKIVGVGLGNIFGGGPIKLRPTADSGKKEDGKSGSKGEPEITPEVAKREKQNTFERAIVRFSYNAEQPDELSLVEGQIIRILDKELEDEGWWKGELHGKVGVFPDNFVELLPNEETSKPKKPPLPTNTTKQSVPVKVSEKSMLNSSDDKIKAENISFSNARKGKKYSVTHSSRHSPGLSKRSQMSRELSCILEAVEQMRDEDSMVLYRPDSRSKIHYYYESLGPSITKKPVAPPPIGKKPLNQKPIEQKIESSGSQKGSLLSKEKSVSGDCDERITEDSRSFDGIEPAGQKLTHLTANRAKGPKKRPPSTVLTLNQPQPPSEPEAPSLPTSAPPAHKDQSAPPPRPPEPNTNKGLPASPALSSPVNKLIEQLQKEMQELRANSVSKTAFNELKAEHEKLKLEFETMRNVHAKKFRELENEVDEEKKLRLTTQVEIERVKKFMSETNV
ncbi:SH3 domain-containing kinase-binding protein 1-like isoform X5 [Biomphalaria glabrata]|uniref:SH3 domain-containing kinase-binding protein 1-like isoform X5 n=1 Tax=Biomphalaria glabrata TaxID=6526 RepID=A0A9W3AKF7_BIOGL|nr:SH3 domain-containing kinase-binding protein 1-like isoform X5 [Biomphalaria glabrata]